ncbi:MAG: VTT domain-containing protein [Myxococcota bacterium]|nr:VTT domain-containing protein [Myxococcota bacterium]
MLDSIVAALGIYAGTLVVGVLSGLVPIVNGEVFLVAMVLLTGQLWPAIALALLVAIGQMIAKVILWKMASRATEAGKDTRLGKKIAQARTKIEKWKEKPLAVTFISALTGLPPFYIVTLLAAALGVRFRTFVILGIIGRVVRFVVIAIIAVRV